MPEDPVLSLKLGDVIVYRPDTEGEGKLFGQVLQHFGPPGFGIVAILPLSGKTVKHIQFSRIIRLASALETLGAQL